MKPLAEQTLYEILDVAPGAGSAEIAAALDRTLTLIGPGSLAMYSLMSPEDATILARRVEEARTTLLDPAARARYDGTLASEDAPPAAAAAPAFPPVIPALVPEQVILEAADGEGEAGEAPDEAAPAPAPTATPAPEAVGSPVSAEPATAAATPEAPSGSTESARAAATPEPPATEPEPTALTPTPGGHVWPAPQPPPAPLQLTTAAPRPIPLEREVKATPPRPAPAAPPAAVRTPAPREATVPEFVSWTGDALRSVREARGLSLQQVAERTKVTRHHIENIEGDRYTSLPAAVYLRGILLSLARELRLDGQKVSRSYLERMTAALAPPPAGPPRR